MNKYVLVLFCLFIFKSCVQMSQTEKDLIGVLNTDLNLKDFDMVKHKGIQIPLEQIKKRYEYFSVIYLQNGCQSCYPKFIRWHQKIDSLNVNDNYALLFVIEGKDYSNFIREVEKIQHVEEKFYVIMDPDGKYLQSNDKIPLWIINNSVLINSKNTIRMVGTPWLNREMLKLFYKTVKNEKQN